MKLPVLNRNRPIILGGFLLLAAFPLFHVRRKPLSTFESCCTLYINSRHKYLLLYVGDTGLEPVAFTMSM